MIDKLSVEGAAQLLVVEVGAGAAGQESKPVPHPFELRSEGVGDARLEPGVHTAARAGKDAPLVPGLPHDHVEAMDAPDGKHVRGVAAAYEDDVVAEDEFAEILRRPGEELEYRHGGPPREEVVALERAPRLFGHSGVDPQQPRTTAT